MSKYLYTMVTHGEFRFQLIRHYTTFKKTVPMSALFTANVNYTEILLDRLIVCMCVPLCYICAPYVCRVSECQKGHQMP